MMDSELDTRLWIWTTCGWCGKRRHTNMLSQFCVVCAWKVLGGVSFSIPGLVIS